MCKRLEFQISYLLLAFLFMTTSCQKEDNDILTQNIDDIAALPETVLFPNNNINSSEKLELGRMLFWDPILSGSKDIACASCHHPNLGYADGRDISSGVNGIGLGPNRVNGDVVKRNTPTILNTAFNGIDTNGDYNPNSAPMFWDNRASGLEEQALLPILSHEEMRGGNIAEENIVDTILQRLNSIPMYRNLFANAFETETITETHLVEALATFQRNIVANNSPFDQYMRGNLQAMSNQQIQGMNTFIDVGCSNCHNGSMFSDYQLHTLSVPNHPQVDDDGATGAFDFRTPSLRNLDLTAPYMHNGIFNNLRDVLDFYNDISGRNPDSQNPNVTDNQIDEDARELRLNGGDINEIISFLNALNDGDFDKNIPQSVPSGLSVGGNID